MSTAMPAMEHDVKDLSLAADGKRRIDWAEREMPVLRLIRDVLPLSAFERRPPGCLRAHHDRNREPCPRIASRRR